MKNLIKYILILVLATSLTGCSAYVKYPSIGVHTEVRPRTKVKTVCRWVQIKPNVKIKRCKKVRVRIR